MGIFVPDAHGAYCGYEARGQEYDSSGEVIGYSAPPEDDLDHDCEMHDSAYGVTFNKSGGKDKCNTNSINLNINDSWERAETDFHLVREGYKYAFHKPIEGLAVAAFGTALLTYYSGPMLFWGAIYSATEFAAKESIAFIEAPRPVLKKTIRKIKKLKF